MGIFSFLSPSKRSSPSEIFQKELADLQLRIERHETRLQSIRARERGTTALVTIYSFVFWFVYGCLWYFGWGFNRWINYFRRTTQPGSGSDRIMTNTGSTLSEILEACPIIIIPVASVLSIFEVSTDNSDVLRYVHLLITIYLSLVQLNVCPTFF
ncbi:hypothetical protein BY996DRAFT_6846040 [Phakopsora pachyrhizi]|nr:hypothetical protein BY996DRAFT_6846040 [Phakopsora pachyrhizi]